MTLQKVVATMVTTLIGIVVGGVFITLFAARIDKFQKRMAIVPTPLYLYYRFKEHTKYDNMIRKRIEVSQ